MPDSFAPTVLLVCPCCGDVVGDDPNATPDPNYIVRDGVTAVQIPAAPDNGPCLMCWEQVG